jgi:inosine-uridine nucleoside N-ribohydrolase
VSAGRVLTCDPGVDDAVALAVAAGRPDARLAAVVAGAGNVDALTAWRNAAGTAVLVGLDVPVGLGSPVAFDGSAIHREGSVHGPDGLVGLGRRLPPADARTREPGRPLVRGDVVATGPLTDVAIALRSGRPVASVVWLGGRLADLADEPPGRLADLADEPPGRLADLADEPPGRLADLADEPPVMPPGGRHADPEFNASADPEAVDAVAAGPAPLSIVPLDVSRRVVLGPDAIARWAAGPIPARFCADLVTARYGPAGGALPDPVAVVAALEPHLFRWEARPVRCSTGGPWPPGTLRIDPAGPAVRLAVAVDAAGVGERIVDAVMSLT